MIKDIIIIYCKVTVVIRGGRYSLKTISWYFKNVCDNDIYDDIHTNMEQRFIGDCSWHIAAFIVQIHFPSFSYELLPDNLIQSVNLLS